jgi:hypothetical protein
MARNWDSDDDGGRKGKGDEASRERADPGAKIEELLHRAEPMIEQINNLYNMFVAGVERLPPTERRKTLEELMMMLQNMQKPNATYQFRVSTLNIRFVTMRERWDRLMRDLESGKIRHSTGPKSKKE